MRPADSGTYHDDANQQCNDESDATDSVYQLSLKAYQHQDKIWINEDLTKKRSTLLWEFRKLKKNKKITDCWSFDGHIKVKDRFNRVISVKDSRDISKF